MKKRHWIILVILLVTLTVVGGVFLLQKWNQPLGAALELPTRTVSLTETADRTPIQPTETQESSDPDQRTPLPALTPTPTAPQPVCGGPPVMYLLGIGVDTRDPNYLYGLADVIRIARVDFVTPKVTVLTLPRDLWVEFPNLKEEYTDLLSHIKLNQAYYYGGPGSNQYYQGPEGGPVLLAHTIAHNYGLYLDHYGAVNMIAFEHIVDALGGIDIFLDQDWDGRPVDDKTVDLGYFYVGQHHMSGAEALRFARIRKKYSDVARSDNQSLVICAIKDKLLNPRVIGDIPQLVNALIGEIQTDLTPAQIGQLTCLLPKLGSDGLAFIRFPEEMLVQGNVYSPGLGDTTFVWDIPVETIREFIRDFENDAIPVDSEGGMRCP